MTMIPMMNSNPMYYGFFLLIVFGIVSFVYSMTFYHALVFVLTDYIYCGRYGGKITCFTIMKFVSLVAVTFGVTWYGYATAATATAATKEDNNQTKNNILEKHQQHRSYTRNHNDRNYCIMKDYERITSTTTGTELTYHHRKYIVDSVLY